MTQKELLYVEDAIGHEKNIISICENMIEEMEEEELIDFLNSELEIHRKTEKNLLDMLEVKVNE